MNRKRILKHILWYLNVVIVLNRWFEPNSILNYSLHIIIYIKKKKKFKTTFLKGMYSIIQNLVWRNRNVFKIKF